MKYLLYIILFIPTVQNAWSNDCYDLAVIENVALIDSKNLCDMNTLLQMNSVVETAEANCKIKYKLLDKKILKNKLKLPKVNKDDLASVLREYNHKRFEGMMGKISDTKNVFRDEKRSLASLADDKDRSSDIIDDCLDAVDCYNELKEKWEREHTSER